MAANIIPWLYENSLGHMVAWLGTPIVVALLLAPGLRKSEPFKSAQRGYNKQSIFWFKVPAAGIAFTFTLFVKATQFWMAKSGTFGRWARRKAAKQASSAYRKQRHRHADEKAIAEGGDIW